MLNSTESCTTVPFFPALPQLLQLLCSNLAFPTSVSESLGKILTSLLLLSLMRHSGFCFISLKTALVLFTTQGKSRSGDSKEKLYTHYRPKARKKGQFIPKEVMSHILWFIKLIIKWLKIRKIGQFWPAEGKRRGCRLQAHVRQQLLPVGSHCGSGQEAKWRTVSAGHSAMISSHSNREKPKRSQSHKDRQLTNTLKEPNMWNLYKLPFRAHPFI